MKERFLPIGTVVLLKGGKKEVMITSYCIFPTKVQKPNGEALGEAPKMYGYGGCIYPEGILDSNMACAFNHGQIEKIIYLGYESEQQKELLHIELTDYNQFPYTYVSKFENGLARVSKSSWRNPNESDWYIDESFNISDRNHNTAQSFLEEKWGDWVFRDVQLGPFKIIADNSEVVVFIYITNKSITFNLPCI